MSVRTEDLIIGFCRGMVSVKMGLSAISKLHLPPGANRAFTRHLPSLR